MRPISRRGVLGLIGGVGAAGALAACGPKKQSSPRSSAGRPAAATTSGSPSTAPADWSKLAGSLRGPLLRPGAKDYVAAARLYNPRFDAQSRPAAIARCADAADVQACVRFVAGTGVRSTIRNGGHSYGGWSTSTGLVVDLSAITSVTVDTAGGTARIGAGARLVDVYTALAAKGVAIAAGSCPTVGVSGLTLGGGVGVLTRAWGLTCDAVRAFDIVTADGRLRKVDASNDADLFWAIRGGGAGFGAVTAWTVATRPAPTIHTFFYAWDIARGTDVLSAWQHWVTRTDTRLWSTCKLLADTAKNRTRVTVSGTWIGPASALDAQLAPLLSATGAPAGQQRKSVSHRDAMLFEAGCSDQSAAQCTAVALGSKREAFAATSSIVKSELPPAAIAAAVAQTKAALKVPGIHQGGVSFDVLGGAVAEVGQDATAFAHRGALATAQYTATWGDPKKAPAPFDAYVRGFRATMRHWLGDAAYVNYADPSIEAYGPAYWATNYQRLQQINRSVDPHGLFASPQSAKP